MSGNIAPSLLAKRKSFYRPEIDRLRAVAILAVLINHLDEHLLPGGYLGVDKFFVISGFVVTASLANRKDSNWQEFLKRFLDDAESSAYGHCLPFQKGLWLREFHELYASEAQCEAALQKAGWPNGF